MLTRSSSRLCSLVLARNAYKASPCCSTVLSVSVTPKSKWNSCVQPHRQLHSPSYVMCGRKKKIDTEPVPIVEEEPEPSSTTIIDSEPVEEEEEEKPKRRGRKKKEIDEESDTPGNILKEMAKSLNASDQAKETKSDDDFYYNDVIFEKDSNVLSNGELSDFDDDDNDSNFHSKPNTTGSRFSDEDDNDHDDDRRKRHICRNFVQLLGYVVKPPEIKRGYLGIFFLTTEAVSRKPDKGSVVFQSMHRVVTPSFLCKRVMKLGSKARVLVTGELNYRLITRNGHHEQEAYIFANDLIVLFRGYRERDSRAHPQTRRL